MKLPHARESHQTWDRLKTHFLKISWNRASSSKAVVLGGHFRGSRFSWQLTAGGFNIIEYNHDNRWDFRFSSLLIWFLIAHWILITIQLYYSENFFITIFVAVFWLPMKKIAAELSSKFCQTLVMRLSEHDWNSFFFVMQVFVSSISVSYELVCLQET